jgi:adenylate cyclase
MSKALVVLLIFISVFSFAQETENDSLRIAIENSKDDSLKVDGLNALSKKYSLESPPSAIHFANLAKALAEKLGYKVGVAYAYKNLGLVYYNQGNYVETVNYWQQSLTMFEAIGYKKGIANILGNFGALYFDQGDDPKALEYDFNSLKISEEIHDTLRMATMLNNIASVYQNKDNTQDKALEFYLRAEPLAEISGDNDLLGSTLVGIGEIYLKKDSSRIKDNPKALDTAVFYFEKSLKVFNNTIHAPYTLNQLGRVYMTKKEFEKAIQYQMQALETSKKFESKNDITISLIGLAQTYQQKGDLKLALQTFKQAEETGSETEGAYRMKDIYEGQTEIYARLRDYSNAFKYQYLLIGVKDTIYNIEKDKKLQGTAFHFEIEKKKDEINLLTKDAQIQQQELHRQKMVRNSFIGGFAVVLLFAGIFFNQRNKISKEKKRSDELLLNILPSETAEELKATGTAKAKSFDAVTVMFTDFKNFTQASEKLTPEELVKEINTCYSEFDKIITKYGIEKIKTIGDSYMCAGGLPATNSTHPVDVIKAGLEMQQFITRNKEDRISKGQPFFDLRLGIHTGPVVAGIVGIKKFAYDIWGDTVNTASRMESSGEIGKVNISGTTYELIKDNPMAIGFKCIHRGKVEAKNKGQIDMYFVESVN